jgi:hypothetical protein
MAKRTMACVGLCAWTLAISGAWSSSGCSPVTRVFGTGGAAGTGGHGTGGHGTGGTGTGGAAPCITGAPCYTGPTGTEHVGACVGGTMDCQADGGAGGGADGGAGSCVGEVVPVPVTPSNCGQHKDLNCDGMTDYCTLDDIWSHVYNTTVGDNNVVRAVAADTSGDVILAGLIAGPIDFGSGLDGGTLTATGAPAQDAFVAKLDPNGNTLWSQRYNDPANPASQQALAVGTDTAGDIFAAGAYVGTIEVGTTMLPGSTSQSAVLLKLDPTGSLIWWRGGINGNTQEVQALAVTPSGGVVVAGSTQGSFAFNFGGKTLTGTAGTTTAFVQAFDASGNPGVGATTTAESPDAGGPSTDHEVTAAAVDTSGNIVVAGYYSGTLIFPNGQSAPAVGTSGASNVWVMELNGTTGGLIWAATCGDGGANRATGVTFDSMGNVLLAGAFTGSMKMGSTTVMAVNPEPVGLFLAHLRGTDGTVTSAQGYGSGSNISTNFMSVQLDAQGNEVLAGSFDGTVSFGGAALTSSTNMQGGLAFYVAKLDPTGAYLASKAFGQNGFAALFGLATVPKTSAIVVGGGTLGPIDLGTGTAEGPPMIAAPFVAEYAP